MEGREQRWRARERQKEQLGEERGVEVKERHGFMDSWLLEGKGGAGTE